MASILALSLLLAMQIGDVQATHCPPSGCPADVTDDAEFIQKHVKVEPPLEKVKADEGGDTTEGSINGKGFVSDEGKRKKTAARDNGEVERFNGSLRGYLGGLSYKCVGGEGTGKALAKLGGLLSMCVRFNLSYVCDPLEWSTASHGTGFVGDLFGCFKKGVIGNRSRIISKGSITKAPVKHIGFEYLTNSSGNPQRISSHTSVSLNNQIVTQILSIEPETPLPLYLLDAEENHTSHRCAVTNLGEARPWIAAQYNLARVARHEKEPLWEGAAWRIALFFRRGDRHGASVAQGVNLLRNLFYAAPWLNPNNSRIVVLAETPRSDPEMQPLLQFSNLRLLCAESAVVDEKGEANQAKLRHDLDYAATANILLSTGGGSFASLMTAIMAEGIAFTLAKSLTDPMLKWKGNVGTTVTPDGKFQCAYDIAGAVVANGATTGKLDFPAPYSVSASSTTLMQQSEKTIESLLEFYRGQKNWENCTALKAAQPNINLKRHFCRRMFSEIVDYSLPKLSPCRKAQLPEVQWLERA